jgi:copper chaperone CopZ
MKAVPGVDTVNVSLEKGLASITLKPGNTATLKQLQNAVTKNGFTMKRSEITVVGKIIENAGSLELQITGSNETVHLIAANNGPGLASLTGKMVKVSGEIPEAAKGKSPDSITYNSILEEKP